MERQEVIQYLEKYRVGIETKSFIIDNEVVEFTWKAINEDTPGHRFKLNDLLNTIQFHARFNPLRLEFAFESFANYLIIKYDIQLKTQPRQGYRDLFVIGYE